MQVILKYIFILKYQKYNFAKKCRKTEVFAYAKNKEYIKVEIYLDET